MNRDINFSRTAVIYSSKESLWKVLLSEGLYERAWGAKLKTTWVPGTDVQFSGTWEEVQYSDKGVVQVNYEYKTLKFSYWSSFWDVADNPDEYCFISFKVDALDNMTCECTISQEGFRDEKHYADTVELLIRTLDTVKLEAEKHFLASFCKNVFDKLIRLIESADARSYNNSLRDRWSPGQIAEHVIISSSGLDQFLADTIPSPTNYDLNISRIRSMMFNMKQKLVTPDVLIPPSRTFDPHHHADQLRAIGSEINHCIETLDFTRKCESFDMPPFGHMSIFEWLTFSGCHIARHTSQMEILVKASASSECTRDHDYA